MKKKKKNHMVNYNNFPQRSVKFQELPLVFRNDDNPPFWILIYITNNPYNHLYPLQLSEYIYIYK